MGYKYKATMYYSDEDTALFLSEHARKRNGKKSASHYLYSLVTKERGSSVITAGKSIDTPIQLYPECYSIEITIYGDIEFASLDNTKAVKNIKNISKKPIYKNVMNEIDNKIKQHIIKNFRDNPLHNVKNPCFLVIRSHIDINTHHTQTVFEYCKGDFEATCLVIKLTQKEEGKFSSNLNFEKIKYYKYEAVSKPNKQIPLALCKVTERQKKDPTGAFFIPVMTVPRQLPDKYEPGGILIMGVDVYHDKYRVKIKESNETQKKLRTLRDHGKE